MSEEMIFLYLVYAWIVFNLATATFAAVSFYRMVRRLRVSRVGGSSKRDLLYPRGFARGQGLRTITACTFAFAGVEILLKGSVLVIMGAAAVGAANIAINAVADARIASRLLAGH